MDLFLKPSQAMVHETYLTIALHGILRAKSNGGDNCDITVDRVDGKLVFTYDGYQVTYDPNDKFFWVQCKQDGNTTSITTQFDYNTEDFAEAAQLIYNWLVLHTHSFEPQGVEA